MYGNGYKIFIFYVKEKQSFYFLFVFFLRGSSQHFYLCTGSYFYCCASAVPLLI